MLKAIGAAVIIAGACLATLGPPLIVHLLPVATGAYANWPMVGTVAAVAFVMLFAGAYMVQSPRGARLRAAFLVSIATTIVCCVMATIFTILVGVILAYAGVKGYGFS